MHAKKGRIPFNLPLIHVSSATSSSLPGGILLMTESLRLIKISDDLDIGRSRRPLCNGALYTEDVCCTTVNFPGQWLH
jgi:hypothetical protein